MTGPGGAGPPPGDLTIADVEVDGHPGATVRIEAGRIAQVDRDGGGKRRATGRGETVVDGHGGALLAGLREHHLHLWSMVARRSSVPCGPPEVTTAEGLGRALRAAAGRAAPGSWVRGYGYDESVTGPLSAADLDALLGPGADRPVRVQHRSGHAWVLNSSALDVLGVERLGHPGVERSPDGSPTGVLFDLDDFVRDGSGTPGPSALAPVGEALARYGVTGVTDASPGNGPVELQLAEAARREGHLGQRVVLLGGPDLPLRRSGPVRTGHLKVMLIERDLPPFDELVATVRGSGTRGVAVHCVTRETVVLAAAALAAAGGGPHRLEHASVAPPDVVDLVRASGATVVTQPGFVTASGDRYLREVEAQDVPWLYRLRAWLHAGVPLAAGSDAPFGPADPWVGIRAAVGRRTAGGRELGPGERLSPEEALGLYQGVLADPGGPPQRVVAGGPADLCLLRVPWRQAREELDSGLVRATVVDGRLVWRDPG